MGFSLFNRQSKEEKFWNWFTKNQKTYYDQAENLDVREQIFEELSTELKQIHGDLVFEFSRIKENGIREFTISADGLKEVFPIVEKILEKSPKISNWKFSAFRQRVSGDDMSLNFQNFNIRYKDIYFRFNETEGKLGIELNIKDYNEEPQMQNAVYILLDNLIGEYDVVMGIDWIDWVKLDESNIESLNPITSLRMLIDRRKEK